MAEQNIPAEMLDAAVEAMVRGEFTQPAANLVLQTANATLERIKLTAKLALEAASVRALLAERDGLLARVAELEALVGDLLGRSESAPC